MSEHDQSTERRQDAARAAVMAEKRDATDEAEGGWGPYVALLFAVVGLFGLLYLTSAPCAVPRLKVIAAGLGGEMDGSMPTCGATAEDCCCSWRASSPCSASFTACSGASLDSYREHSDCGSMSF